MKNRLLIVLLLMISNLSFSQTDSLEDSLLNTNYDPYLANIQFDTIINTTPFSEYIEFGFLSFSTRKDISTYIKRLKKNLGRPQKVNNELRWHNVYYFGHKNYSIYLSKSEESNPNRNEVTLYIFDDYMQPVSDTSILNQEKRRIHELVFNQSKIQFKESPKDNIVTLGKNPVFSFWRDIRPLNFDSVMILLSENGFTCNKWNYLKLKIIINPNNEKKISNLILEPEGGDTLWGNFEDEKWIDYFKYFRFPMYEGKSKSIIISFSFEDIFSKLKYIQRVKNELLNNDIDSLFVDTVNYYSVFTTSDINLGKKKGLKLLYDGLKFHVYEGNKLYEKYSFDYESDVFYINIVDINEDGYNDIILPSPPNMNGNQWCDLFMYIPEKDSFALTNTSITLGWFSDGDSLYIDSVTSKKVKSGYKIVQYGGSWYMPNTTTVYKWNDYYLEPILIIGTELLFRTMTSEDFMMKFLYEMKNDKLILTKQQNESAPSFPKNYVPINDLELLKPYLE